MSVHFDERSGVVPCKTPWGSWYQTMEEVFIEVNVPRGTSGKEVTCHLGPRLIDLSVKGKQIFKVIGFFDRRSKSDSLSWVCLAVVCLYNTWNDSNLT